MSLPRSTVSRPEPIAEEPLSPSQLAGAENRAPENRAPENRAPEKAPRRDRTSAAVDTHVKRFRNKM